MYHVTDFDQCATWYINTLFKQRFPRRNTYVYKLNHNTIQNISHCCCVRDTFSALSNFPEDTIVPDCPFLWLRRQIDSVSSFQKRNETRHFNGCCSFVHMSVHLTVSFEALGSKITKKRAVECLNRWF